MRKLLALTCLSSILNVAYGDISSISVNIRDEKSNLKAVDMEPGRFVRGGYLESENFKILKGTKDATAHVDDAEISEQDKIRAGTALHHLEIARDYFVNTLNSDFAEKLPQLNIRIDMSKPFNQYYRFVGDSKLDEYNNVVTIPASNALAKSNWNTEIWFRPAKTQEIDNSVYLVSKELDNLNFSSHLGMTLADQTLRDAVIQQALYGSVATLDYSGHVNNLLTLLGLFEFTPKVMMLATKSLKTETFLDSAMIPEIIYHEYAHVALSDHISLRRSSPLNEGISNYFAAVISKSSQIGVKNGKHSKNAGGYNGEDKTKYKATMETAMASHSNFVFSFLWGLRSRIAKEFLNGELLADKLIFNSRRHIVYAEKSIKDSLLPGLINAVEETFPGGNARKLRLLINDEALKRGI